MPLKTKYDFSSLHEALEYGRLKNGTRIGKSDREKFELVEGRLNTDTNPIDGKILLDNSREESQRCYQLLLDALSGLPDTKQRVGWSRYEAAVKSLLANNPSRKAAAQADEGHKLEVARLRREGINNENSIVHLGAPLNASAEGYIPSGAVNNDRSPRNTVLAGRQDRRALKPSAERVKKENKAPLMASYTDAAHAKKLLDAWKNCVGKIGNSTIVVILNAAIVDAADSEFSTDIAKVALCSGAHKQLEATGQIYDMFRFVAKHPDAFGKAWKEHFENHNARGFNRLLAEHKSIPPENVALLSQAIKDAIKHSEQRLKPHYLRGRSDDRSNSK